MPPSPKNRNDTYKRCSEFTATLVLHCMGVWSQQDLDRCERNDKEDPWCYFPL